MARNPFEQLQDVAHEPRQTFEDTAAQVLRATDPGHRRVRVFRGDGGIDSYKGLMGDEGSVDVFQIKYFPNAWAESQKAQIRDSYRTARSSPDFQLNEWTLCVPVRLTKDDLRWFDDWRVKQDRTINLLDGDDLTEKLAQEACSDIRARLRHLGVLGLPDETSARFTALAFVQPKDPSKTGLISTIGVRLTNQGLRSAKSVKVVLSHEETGCVHYGPFSEWVASDSSGLLNPRRLRFTGVLNPGDYSDVMCIPLCARSEMPFWVELVITAEDAPPLTLRCEFSPEQLTSKQHFVFSTISALPEERQGESDTREFLPPNSQLAKDLLICILEHPEAEERGLTEILRASPGGPTEVSFITNATAAGNAPSVKKAVFRPAIQELMQLGWLLTPEEDWAVRVYPLNPRTPGDALDRLREA